MQAGRTIWILMNPDNKHWSEEEADKAIEYYASHWDVEVFPTGDTRDVGFGQERLFVLDGSVENTEGFESDIYEAFN